MSANRWFHGLIGAVGSRMAHLLSRGLLPAAVLAVGLSARGQTYSWVNFVGLPGGLGNTDASGSTARFHGPYGMAVDSAGNVYVADSINNTIRKTSVSGVVTTLAGRPGLSGSTDGTGSAARFSHPMAVAVDSAGNVYVADQWNHTLRKITPAGVVTTLAGSPGSAGNVDGTGSAARFNYPSGLAVDGAGNVYVTDGAGHTVRKVTAAGVVTTLAGSAGVIGSADGTGSAARFNYPTGLAVDGAGNVYVGDRVNHTIRMITPAGVVTTLAGLALNAGSTDGTGSAARFNGPAGVALDDAGNLYVADQNNHIVRKVTPGGVVTTYAGSAGITGSADGPSGVARFTSPTGVGVDGAGNIFVAQEGHHTIRKISPDGMVTTVAGQPGVSGSADGGMRTARFYNPYGMARDSAGNLYVADRMSHTIRKITPSGVVTTLAGLYGNVGGADGIGSAARFSGPAGVGVDSAGNVYVADSGNHTIRKVTSAGVVTTLAGSAGLSGSADGTGSAARFWTPTGVAVDSAGNVFVADFNNYTVRQVTSAGVVTTLAGSAGLSGSADGTGAAARFNSPAGVGVDSAGNVYVTDFNNATIRKVTSAGVVTTLAGSAGSPGSADGTGPAARFFQPNGLAVDSAGNVYVADEYNHTIRRVTSSGVVTTLAGSAGSPGSADGTGSAARFYLPTGVALDGVGKVYVTDQINHTIRKVTAAGVVTTVAGSAAAGGTADGIGRSARVGLPCDIGMDSSGNLYLSTFATHTIRKITPAGVVTTLAGSPGVAGSADGTGSAARFAGPTGVALDAAGNVYVADYFNHTIRKITSAGVVTTLAGSPGVAGSADGTGSAARFAYPRGVVVDGAGNVYVADQNNHTIRMVTSAGVVTTLAGSPGAWGSADGTGSAARFYSPTGLGIDSAGNLFVGDMNNHAIRMVTPAGVVTTLAGSPGVIGSADGSGSAARFYSPVSVAVDASGNLFVGDMNNQIIRRVTSAGVVTTVGGTAGVIGGDGGVGGSAQFYLPHGVAVAANGIVYVADYQNHRISRGRPGTLLSVNSPLPRGQAGTPYNQALTAVGGTAPYTFSVSGGTLPAGLTLTSSGVIDGVPAAGGTTTVEVTVSDAGAVVDTLAYELMFDASPTAVVLVDLAAGVDGGKCVVRWRTASELDTVAFALERLGADGQWIRLNAAPIPATGFPNGGIGATYTFEDVSAVAGAKYTYRLVELTTGGAEEVYGPFERVMAQELKMTDLLTLGPEGLRLRWLSQAGETYRVLRATDLADGGWTPVAEGLSATPPENAWTDPQPPPCGVYRIERVQP